MKAFKMKQLDKALIPKNSLKKMALTQIKQALKEFKSGVYTF